MTGRPRHPYKVISLSGTCVAHVMGVEDALRLVSHMPGAKIRYKRRTLFFNDGDLDPMCPGTEKMVNARAARIDRSAAA